MKLYVSAASSYSRKIRVMLIEKGVRHDVEMVNLWEPNDLKQTNPIGKVPALDRLWKKMEARESFQQTVPPQA
jgi:glutathione S-transferase